MAKYLTALIRSQTTPELRDHNNPTPQPDPMREMRAIGNGLMWVGTAALGSTAAVSMLPGLSSIKSIAKNTANKLGGNLLGVALSVATIMIFAILALGIVLAWLIPALPYTTWTLALLGYLITFCEALVAAPIWALAHAWPEGEGPTSGQSKAGYVLILRILLKPVLMLFGFFIGMQLVYVMGWYVDITIWDTLNHAFDGGALHVGSVDFAAGNPFSLIGMLVVYTGLMLAIVHKSFEMTHELDDWVFEWIGGSARNMGENSAHQTHVMGAMSTVKQQSGSTGSAVSHALSGMGSGDDVAGRANKALNQTPQAGGDREPKDVPRD